MDMDSVSPAGGPRVCDSQTSESYRSLFFSPAQSPATFHAWWVNFW